tara:strand:- start:4557 stop:4718 length:162 start_codon:yes stop_codon:yes gene_type:complete
MIKEILEMLEFVKDDTKNLGELSKIALGKNKIPESMNEIFHLTILRNGRRSKS